MSFLYGIPVLANTSMYVLCSAQEKQILSHTISKLSFILSAYVSYTIVGLRMIFADAWLGWCGNTSQVAEIV